jgi:serine/threonine-protein kinase ATR
MAPFAGSPLKRIQQSSQVNGLSGIQDAPPSTLAANLANNLSNNRRPSRNEEHEDFQRLLLEVSKQEGDPNTTNSEEALIEHHHKLIYVVAKAVLEVLIKDHGLFNDQLLQQASEGLDILIATIKETPEVLAHVAGQHANLQSGKNVPLWLWLFPRILALVGRPRCDTLQEKITEFFRICFWAVSRSLQLWTLNSSFFLYLHHCTDSKYSALAFGTLN